VGYLKSIIWESGLNCCRSGSGRLAGWCEYGSRFLGSVNIELRYWRSMSEYVCVEWFLHMLISSVSSFSH